MPNPATDPHGAYWLNTVATELREENLNAREIVYSGTNINTVAASGAAQTIPDPRVTPNNHITLTGNCVLTFPTAGTGRGFTLALKQDATGGRTVTWPATVKWAGGATPTLTVTAARWDVFSFVCLDGTNWFGFVGGLNFS